MKILCGLGKAFFGIAKFCKNIIFISFIFVLSMFVLAVIMPENVKIAIEIFSNLIKNA